MGAVAVASRLILGLYFAFAGVGHFAQPRPMAEQVEARGLPAPLAGVLGTGVMLLAGGLSIALGLWMWVGAVVLIVFLVIVTPTMHNFWAIEDETERQMQMVGFLKNVGLIGALLMFIYVDVELDDVGPWSIT